MRLHGLEIPVLDLQRAVAFYTRVLRFPLVTRGERFALLFLGDVHGGMVTLRPAADDEVGRGPAIVLFADEGVDGERRRLEEMGVKFLGPTEREGLGPTAWFRDSEGNKLALRQPSLTARFRSERARTPQELADELAALAAKTSAVLAPVTEAQARSGGGEGEWSILDQAGHIVDSLESGLAISLALASGHRPPEDRLWRESYPVASLPAVRDDLARAFQRFEAALRAYPAEPDLDARLLHGVFGPLNCLDWIAFTRFHVGLHLDQIEALKGSGGRREG